MTAVTERGGLDTEVETPPRGPVPSDDTAPTSVTARGAQAEASRRRADAEFQALREDVEWLSAHGETRAGIERRVGTSWKSLQRRWLRYGMSLPDPPGDYELWRVRREQWSAR